MKKAWIVIVSLLFGVQVFAHPFSQVQKKFYQQKMSTNKNLKPIHIDSYTDFSGTWQGRCDGEEEVIVIENDAEHILINDMAFAIPGVAKFGGATINYVGDANMFIQWADNGKRLRMDMTGFFAGLPAQDKNEESPFGMMIGAGSISLEGNKLVMTESMTLYIDGKVMDRDTSSCIYERQ